MKKLSLLILVALLTFGAIAQPMRIVTTDWVPYTVQQGSVSSGLALEIATGVFESMDVAINYLFFPWDRSTLMVRNGQAEAIVSISRNAERETYLVYPETPLHASRYVLFAHKDNIERYRYTNYTGLRNVVFGLTRGYTYTPEFISHVRTNNRVQEVDSDTSGMRMVGNKRIGIMICDQANGMAILRELGLTNSVVMIPGPPISSKDYYIAFSRATTYGDMVAFSRMFNTALIRFKTTSRYREILGQYE